MALFCTLALALAMPVSAAETLDGKVPLCDTQAQLIRELTKRLRDTHEVKFGFEEYSFRTQGKTAWIVPHLVPAGEQELSECLILTPQAGVYRAEHLYFAEYFVPSDGVLVDDQLLVGGPTFFTSNGSSAEFRLFRRRSHGWKQVASAWTEFQMYGVKFTRQNGRWGSRVFGRNYPKHMSVSHALASIEMSQQFALVDGTLKASPEVRLPTPQATLDDAIGAGQAGNVKQLRSLCSNQDLARRMQILAPFLTETGWDADPYRRVWTAYNLGREFHFAKRGGRWLVAEIRMVKPTE